MSKKTKKIIKIIWIIMGLCAGAGLFACLFSGGDLEMIFEDILPIVFGMMLIGITLTILAVILSNLGEKLGKREYEKERFSPIDRKNEEYYREILDVNTPLILGVIDNYDVSIENVIAELLYLKKKKIIDFINGRIVILASDNSNLDDIHQYIIKNIDENGKFVFDKNGILDVTLNSIKRMKLFEKASISKVSEEKIIKKAIFFSCSIFALIIGFFGYIGDGDYMEALEVFGTPAAALSVFFLVAYLRKYDLHASSVPYLRTKEGEKLNEKLEGLKKYLKDYSLLDEKEVNALELWDEYLIYSVMFNQNKKIVEEYTKYIMMKD